MLIHGDLIDVLPTLTDASIDACVTDPPYDLTTGKRGGSGIASVNLDSPQGRSRVGTGTGGGFMGKAWDSTGIAFDPATWRHVYRVLKPGAYLVAFGGSRTSHRMVCAIEDAGFEIRDSLVWLYGQGFPKSKDLGDGRGTALKPAHEPIALAWKPFKGSISGNVATHGTGALNIDACRVEGLKPDMVHIPKATDPKMFQTPSATNTGEMSDVGRWPANVLLDEEAADLLDEQTGDLGFSSGTEVAGEANPHGIYGNRQKEGRGQIGFADRGGASRFYYVAKPSREERDYGTQAGGNFHPTVKPVELMRWLVKLVTPSAGTVLDPFTGSGTTGMACRYEFREFVGIEREAEYVAIAECRIAAVAPLFN